jgi:hypothetical protein
MEHTFLESLRRHRTDAVAERDRLIERIRALDVLIAQESKSPTAPVAGLSSRPAFGTGGAVTVAAMPLPAAVTEALTRHGGALGFPDLLAAVSQVQGQDVNEKSLRGTLPRMEREGKLVKPQRGLYALPATTEGPTVDAVRPSDVSGPAPEGGEYTDGQGSHHDHRDDLRGRNGDHDHLGASVGH